LHGHSISLELNEGTRNHIVITHFFTTMSDESQEKNESYETKVEGTCPVQCPKQICRLPNNTSSCEVLPDGRILMLTENQGLLVTHPDTLNVNYHYNVPEDLDTMIHIHNEHVLFWGSCGFACLNTNSMTFGQYHEVSQIRDLELLFDKQFAVITNKRLYVYKFTDDCEIRYVQEINFDKFRIKDREDVELHGTSDGVLCEMDRDVYYVKLK
jgi:hypothetical protein